jgi:4'-phosphopantetheinyl transferase
LPDDEVHVWRAALELEPAGYSELEKVLSADELARARRFHFARDRNHFIAGRAILRQVLAAYLNRQPSQLQFSSGPAGKPGLAASSDSNGLCFNLSHSHGLALYAITRHREIGVDIEHLRSDFPCEQVAERFFSPREISSLRLISDTMRHEAFFNCWTRKEAYIKGRGDGLGFPLDRFDVSLAPEEPAALLNTEDDPQEVSRWSLTKLNPGAGFVAAVAVKGHGWQLATWEWKQLSATLRPFGARETA